MDIRTKLVFALVAVSLASMAVLGFVMYSAAGTLLRESSLRQLEALAESKKDDLRTEYLGWEETVRLVASRTQLRLSLRELAETGDPVQRSRIERILVDADRSGRTIRRLTVYGLDLAPIFSTGAVPVDSLPPIDRGRLPPGETARYEGIRLVPEDGLEVGFVCVLTLDGERIGILEVTLSADQLREIIADSTGLGETGETVLAFREAATGDTHLIHATPVPADTLGGLQLRVTRPDSPSTVAIGGQDTVLIEALDYRGEPVWAATRYLAEPEWGIVVKFDKAEEREPIVELRRTMTDLALSVSAFAILAGILLGFHFARPIHDLARVVQRLRDGDLDARADTSSEDEVGLLARAFNEMAEELSLAQGEVLLSSDPGGPERAGDAARPEDSERSGDEPA